MIDHDYDWKKTFYEDEYNPAIPLIRKTCEWIVLNYPDFSLTFGFKRVIVNVCMIFAVTAVLMYLMVTNTGWLDFIVKLFLASCIASLLFLKTFAVAMLWGLDSYQAIMRLGLYTPECKRCGKCCLSCKHLIKLPNGLTECSIYKNRLGTEIAPGVKCKPREQGLWDFPGCPYNTNKPLFTKQALAKAMKKARG